MVIAGGTGQGSPVFLLFERRKIEQVVVALEDSINERLIRVLAISAPDDVRDAWKETLKRLFLRISMIRYKGSNEIPSADWLVGILYGPYKGVEEMNIAAMIVLLLVGGSGRNDVTDADVVARFKDFYAALPGKLAHGDPGYGLIDAL